MLPHPSASRALPAGALALLASLALPACSQITAPGDACTRHGYKGSHLSSIQMDWRQVPARSGTMEATINLHPEEDCTFALVIGGTAPLVHCDVSGLRLPFTAGQKVRVTYCDNEAGLNAAEYLVIRDPSGVLLFAGGGGARMLDVGCIPPELKVRRVEGGCEAFTPTPDVMADCHDNRNFGLKFEAESTLTLWPKERGELRLAGRPYDAFALFSYDVVWREGLARCSDTPPDKVGYAVVRR
ncbi:MAG: hypothetical protein IT371_25935 [Deltaproteobacteria bacterium]|nr:hypothetical protein [Deltaproteobacteria bacterium]